MFSQEILPPAIRQSNIKWWLTQPGYLKSHHWQFLAGMMGAYMLQGFLGDLKVVAIFRCLSLFQNLMVNHFCTSALPGFAYETKSVIAELDTVMSACESGILCHLVIHVAERVVTAGPPWAHAMWAWVCMWGHLVRWLKQKNHPATGYMNGY